MSSSWLNKPYRGAFINTSEISNLSMRENLVMTSLYGRTSIRFYRVGLSRHESLPLHWRALTPVVSKGFGLGRGRNGFDTFIKMAGKYTDKRQLMAREISKRSLSFPFVDKRNLFLTKLFFEELNLVFCKVERLACFWNNRGTQGGYSRFSSDGDDRMGAKIPGTSNKTPSKIP